MVVSGGNFPGRPLQCLPTVPKNRNCSSRTAATPMPFLLTGMALNLNFMAFERGVLQGRLFVYVNAVMHTHSQHFILRGLALGGREDRTWTLKSEHLHAFAAPRRHCRVVACVHCVQCLTATGAAIVCTDAGAVGVTSARIIPLTSHDPGCSRVIIAGEGEKIETKRWRCGVSIPVPLAC